MAEEITDVKPPKGFPHITDLTGTEATILQVANEQGDILGYATMADIDAYIESKVAQTIHSFTAKQTFQDVTINGTFDGNNVYDKHSVDQLFTQKENDGIVTFKKTTNSSSTVMNLESSYDDGKCYLGFRNKDKHLGYFGYTADNKPLFYDIRRSVDLIIPSIEVVTKTYADITINSNNYASVGSIISATDNRFVIGFRLKSWSSNTGAFAIFPYANNLCYAVGNAGVQIKGLAVDWFVATL